MPLPISAPELPERETLLRIHLTRPLLLCVALTILLIVTFAQIPGSTKLAQTLQNSGHAPAFCLLALTVIQFIWQPGGATRYPTLRQYVTAFVACIVAGIFVELVQAGTGRYLSGLDVVADAVGTLCGLSGHAYWQLRGTELAKQPRILVLPAISFACFVIAVLPATWSFAAYVNRNARFPVLAEFDSPLDLYFVDTPGGRAELASGSKVPGSKDPRVEVRVHSRFPGNWPGFHLDEPVADWSQFEALVLEIENPDASPMELNIRIQDQLHNEKPNDRYQRRLQIGATERRVIRVPLDAIEHEPEGRTMALSRMGSIVIFGDKSLAGRKFIVRRIWLEGTRRAGLTGTSTPGG